MKGGDTRLKNMLERGITVNMEFSSIVNATSELVLGFKWEDGYSFELDLVTEKFMISNNKITIVNFVSVFARDTDAFFMCGSELTIDIDKLATVFQESFSNSILYTQSYNNVEKRKQKILSERKIEDMEFESKKGFIFIKENSGYETNPHLIGLGLNIVRVSGTCFFQKDFNHRTGCAH